ncbi:MAG: M64 family metallopeptidase [Acidobacteriota bacterium]
MKIRTLFFLLSILIIPIVSATGNVTFNEHYTGNTLRIDFFHTWEKTYEAVKLDAVYKEGPWAGNPDSLLDPFGYGRYKIKLFTKDTSQLIYSKGYDSYFGEYKTTNDAAAGKRKTFHETALLPFPKKPVTFVLELMNKKGGTEKLISLDLDPSSPDIKEAEKKDDKTILPVHNTGDPSKKVDLVIIAEGYRAEDENKLKRDLEKVKKTFFSQQPYKKEKDKFNINCVFKPSKDSGPDEPRQKIFRDTAISATFNSLGSSRYLLTEDNRSLRNIASMVPYDAIIIMVNSKRYGGGGIYNSFCTFTSDNRQTSYLLLHEFGHSFSGLADEYYSSSVAYNDFYPKGSEPVEANITALLDPENLKWKDYVTEGIKIPTPWGKTEYDEKSKKFRKKRAALNKKIEKMSKNNFPKFAIKKVKAELDELIEKNRKDTKSFFSDNKLKDSVGAFEGAGYSSEGLYRPMLDCIMFSIGQKPYCRVCEKAVSDMINYYTR